MFFINVTLRRIFRRLKYFPIFIYEAFKWECESCKRCGSIFRIMWNVKDEIWNKVTNQGNGSYCVDCFVKIAEKKGIRIKSEDIKLELFYFRKD